MLHFNIFSYFYSLTLLIILVATTEPRFYEIAGQARNEGLMTPLQK